MPSRSISGHHSYGCCGGLHAGGCQEPADELSGNAPGKAASNPVCNLFQQAEIAKYLGVATGAAENRNVPNGIGCFWATKDYESWVAISTYSVAEAMGSDTFDIVRTRMQGRLNHVLDCDVDLLVRVRRSSGKAA